MVRLSGFAVALLLTVSVGGCAAMPSAVDLVEANAQQSVVTAADARRAMAQYVQAVNRALRRGNVDDLLEVTAARCPCAQLVGFVRNSFDEGGELAGARFRVRDVTVLDVREGRSEADVRAVVSISQYDVRTSDGIVVSTEPATRYTATYTLREAGGQWQAIDVRQNQK
ncbi:MAG: hypothetical protein GEU93_09980 [Propionibacteriales bacterium]|nr:hypothetical protein [Propionibacteriales bacterium]